MANDIGVVEMLPSVCDVCLRGRQLGPGALVAPAAQRPGSLYTMAGLGRVEGVETWILVPTAEPLDLMLQPFAAQRGTCSGWFTWYEKSPVQR